MQFLAYLSTPLVCAVIGWFTNFLAVKMLFHPRRPLRLGLVTLQGVFPKRQKVLAENLGRMIESELLGHADVQAILTSPDFQEKLDQGLQAQVEHFITRRIPQAIPMAGMFLTPEIMDRIREVLVTEMKQVVAGLVEQASAELEDNLNVRELVREKVEAFAPEKLEELLFALMKREFRTIEALGGVLGLLIGSLQSAALYFLG